MWKICHPSQDYIGEISENKLWSTGHFPWLWNIKQKITQLKVLIVSGVYEINITLDFHIHCTFFIFVFFCVRWLKVSGYLWNCYWPLLFKISFHKLNYAFVIWGKNFEQIYHVWEGYLWKIPLPIWCICLIALNII